MSQYVWKGISLVETVGAHIRGNDEVEVFEGDLSQQLCKSTGPRSQFSQSFVRSEGTITLRGEQIERAARSTLAPCFRRPRGFLNHTVINWPRCTVFVQMKTGPWKWNENRGS